MPRRSKPTFPIPREVIEAAEIKRCLVEDDQPASASLPSSGIRGRRSFPEALEVAREYVILEVSDGDDAP